MLFKVAIFKNNCSILFYKIIWIDLKNKFILMSEVPISNCFLIF